MSFMLHYPLLRTYGIALLVFPDTNTVGNMVGVKTKEYFIHSFVGGGRGGKNAEWTQLSQV